MVRAFAGDSTIISGFAIGVIGYAASVADCQAPVRCYHLPDREEEPTMGPWLVDVQSKEGIEEWLSGNPPTPYRPVVMVVRGDSDLIREFLPNALDAAKLDEQRVVVWVKDPSVLDDERIWGLFADDHDAVASVLNEDRELAARVYSGRIEVSDAAFAFDIAQGR